MPFIKVSDNRGINLDQVLEWFDYAAADEPTLLLVTVAASETEHGQRQPHEITLTREARLTMLHWLDQCHPAQDWKAAYEEMRAENQELARRLHAFEAEVTEAEGRRIWERIHAEERTP
jgi:hypothetical protein